MLKPGAMSKDEFMKEARIMKAARHPRLVRLYTVCVEDPIYIITELMPHGSLLDYLRDGVGKHLTLRPLIDMMAQVSIINSIMFYAFRANTASLLLVC